MPLPGAEEEKDDDSAHGVATGLAVPTGMTFGPDGLGAAPAGAGQILRISIP